MEYMARGDDGDTEDIGNMCPDYIIGLGTGVAAWMGGEAEYLLEGTIFPRPSFS